MLVKQREPHFEHLLNCIVKASIEHNFHDECLKFLVKLSGMQTELSDTDAHGKRPSYCVRGILMDLIEIIQPELCSVASAQLLSVLFRPPGRALSSIPLGTGGGYLLSRLVHEASWWALHRTIDSLLIEDLPLQVSSSFVLEFLWACIQKPCLWQGKAKKEGIVNSKISMVCQYLLCLYGMYYACMCVFVCVYI